MSVLYKIAASPLSLLAEGVFLGIAVYMALTGKGDGGPLRESDE